MSEKVYRHRLKQQQMAKEIWKNHGAPNTAEGKRNLKNSVNETVNKLVEGRRILNVDILAKEMVCKKCNTRLHLSDIEEEKQFGLASIFYIRCPEYKVICTVATDTKHSTSNNHKHFDTNTKTIIGTINAGMGVTHLNKFLVALNMAPIHWKTFKAMREKSEFVQNRCLGKVVSKQL